MSEIDYVDNTTIDVFGIRYPMPYGTLSKRDLKSQFPLQIYPGIWQKLFKPGDVVYDIGAYIGLISIHLAMLGGVVHAFEGSPRNVPRLKKVCRPLRQVVIHPVAVSDRNHIASTRFNDCIDREHREQEIEFVRLDDYTKDLPKPAFIKMDIEGMETMALWGMENLLEARVPMQIEWHKNLPFAYEHYPGFVAPEDGGFDFGKFADYGYSIYDDQLQPKSVDELESLKNYFFVPKNKFAAAKLL